MPGARPDQPETDETIALRPARRDDLDAMQAIEVAAFTTDRISRRAMRALLAGATAGITVATRAGVVIGYSLVLRRRGSRAARLYSLAVRPEAAGNGLGRRLLAAAEAEAARGGAERLRLEVRSDNAPASRLYESSGYQRTGRIAEYYADGCAALRYERLLPTAR